MTQTASVPEATKTIELIRQGKNKNLLSLIPEGQSPKVYLDLLKSQIFGNKGSDDEFLLFLYTAKRTGLDPLAGQLHAVFRWDGRLGRDKMAIQTGIDGFRLVAQRTNQYAGQDDAVFTPEDEDTKYPTKASVTIYKVIKGARVAFTATARWKEYAVWNKTKDGMKLSPMWERMPYAMLAKCAEALALRKGFPNELSGLYSQEEMAQADNPLMDLPIPASKERPVITHGGTEVDQVSKPVELATPEAKNVTEAMKQEPEQPSATQVKPEVVKDIAKIRKELVDDPAVEIN
jgi:phage recombination protein Bet